MAVGVVESGPTLQDMIGWRTECFICVHVSCRFMTTAMKTANRHDRTIAAQCGAARCSIVRRCQEATTTATTSPWTQHTSTPLPIEWYTRSEACPPLSIVLRSGERSRTPTKTCELHIPTPAADTTTPRYATLHAPYTTIFDRKRPPCTPSAQSAGQTAIAQLSQELQHPNSPLHYRPPHDHPPPHVALPDSSDEVEHILHTLYTTHHGLLQR